MCTRQQINTLRFISFTKNWKKKFNTNLWTSIGRFISTNRNQQLTLLLATMKITREINPKTTMESFNLLVRCLLLGDKVKKLVIYKRRVCGGIIHQWCRDSVPTVLTTHLTTLNSSYNTFISHSE